MSRNKIVFLDIDGVLITARSKMAYGNSPAFDPVAGRIVDAVCKVAPAQIVICSAWREQRTREVFVEILQLAQISPEYLHPDWATPILGGARGGEVMNWIEAHPEVLEYAIVDDGLGFEEPDCRCHLVQPDADFGIGIREIVDLCAVLNVDVQAWFSGVSLRIGDEESRRFRERRLLLG